MAGVAFFETDPTGGLGATVGGGEGARAHGERAGANTTTSVASTSSTSLASMHTLVLLIRA